MEPRTFVRFVGTLWENMEFEPGIGWETPRIARAPNPDPDYYLELRDMEDRVLVVRSPEVAFRFGCPLGGEMRAARVIGYLPVRNTGTCLVFRYRDTLLYQTMLAESRPEISITHLDIDRDAQRITVAWDAMHTHSLHFMVRLLINDRRIVTVACDLTSSQLSINTSALPGGVACRLVVLASDGLRSAHVLSAPFTLQMRPPRVWIGAPLAGERLMPDQPFTLQGGAIDQLGEPLKEGYLVWLINGVVVARGSCCALAGPLPPGAHVVTLRYADHDGHTAEENVEVQIPHRTPGQDYWREVVRGLLVPDDSITYGAGGDTSNTSQL